MEDVKIRRTTDDDAEELARVCRSAYQENRKLGFPAKAESVSESEVAEWIREARVYVATVESEVVGGVRLEETAPARVKLSRLGVHEDWKGEGIGGELLKRTEKVVRDEGYETIWLTTPESHPYLAKLYRRRGYEETEPYPLEYREYDEVVMEKRLR